MLCTSGSIWREKNTFGQIVYVLNLPLTCERQTSPISVSYFSEQSLCRGLGSGRVRSGERGETAVGEQRTEEDHRQHRGLGNDQAAGCREKAAERRPRERYMS